MTDSFKTLEVLRDVRRERDRQVRSEGYTQAHDDQYRNFELVRAAAAYCCISIPILDGIAKALWPWNWNFWKPTTRRRNLIKAAALIVAEIERIDREEEELCASKS